MTNMKSTAPHKRPYAQTARAQAAEQTGRRIVQAFLDRFLADWLDEITLDRVAADAGVTVQTVVRRFGSKDGLLQAALDLFSSQVEARRATPSGDLDEQIAHLIHDYETSGDPVLRMLALEQRHPALKPFLDTGRRAHRAWVTQSFAPALAPFQGDPRERAIDMLVIATDVFTWKLLRRDMGRSLPATHDAIKGLVRGIFAGQVKSPP